MSVLSQIKKKLYWIDPILEVPVEVPNLAKPFSEAHIPYIQCKALEIFNDPSFFTVFNEDIRIRVIQRLYQEKQLTRELFSLSLAKLIITAPLLAEEKPLYQQALSYLYSFDKKRMKLTIESAPEKIFQQVILILPEKVKQHCIELELRDHYKIESLFWLTCFHFIKYLDLTGCSGLTSIEGIENCLNLNHLNITQCSRIENINSLKNIKHPKLISLIAKGCLSLRCIEGIQKHPLIYLNLSENHRLKSLNPLSALKNVIQKIDVSYLVKVSSFDLFKQLDALQELDIRGTTLSKKTFLIKQFKLECPLVYVYD